MQKSMEPLRTNTQLLQSGKKKNFGMTAIKRGHYRWEEEWLNSLQ
jgi:hypothetical protein